MKSVGLPRRLAMTAYRYAPRVSTWAARQYSKVVHSRPGNLLGLQWSTDQGGGAVQYFMSLVRDASLTGDLHNPTKRDALARICSIGGRQAIDCLAELLTTEDLLYMPNERLWKTTARGLNQLDPARLNEVLYQLLGNSNNRQRLNIIPIIADAVTSPQACAALTAAQTQLKNEAALADRQPPPQLRPDKQRISVAPLIRGTILPKIGKALKRIEAV